MVLDSTLSLSNPRHQCRLIYFIGPFGEPGHGKADEGGHATFFNLRVWRAGPLSRSTHEPFNPHTMTAPASAATDSCPINGPPHQTITAPALTSLNCCPANGPPHQTITTPVPASPDHCHVHGLCQPPQSTVRHALISCPCGNFHDRPCP